VPAAGTRPLRFVVGREDMKSIVATLLIAGLTPITLGDTANEVVVWVRVYDVDVHLAPSFASSSVGRAHFTQPLQLLGVTNAWCHVTTGCRPSRFAYAGTNGWVPATNAVPLEGWIHSSSVTTNPLPPASMTEVPRPTVVWSGHGGSNEAMRVMKELERGQQRRP
jgi:hypothetical protein